MHWPKTIVEFLGLSEILERENNQNSISHWDTFAE